MTVKAQAAQSFQDQRLIVSEFSGAAIPIWSEAWRHECEVAFLLGSADCQAE